MRLYSPVLAVLLISACAPTSTVETFNAQPAEDRSAAINACLGAVGRGPAPAGSLQIDPPLTPEEGSVFASCLARS